MLSNIDAQNKILCGDCGCYITECTCVDTGVTVYGYAAVRQGETGTRIDISSIRSNAHDCESDAVRTQELYRSAYKNYKVTEIVRVKIDAIPSHV